MRSRAASLILSLLLLSALVAIPSCTASTSGSTSATSTDRGSSASGATSHVPGSQLTPSTFAVIGDYGVDNKNERAVAKLVASWKPAFVLAVGDCYYNGAGGKGTAKYDNSTGAYYGTWLKDITTSGNRYPVGTAKVNAFFPAMGNHDLSDATPSPGAYLTYFDLPGSDFKSTSGNERYYDFVEGPIHFFVLDSNPQEPDGASKTSKQAMWLKRGLAASTSRWNIVYDHHPPYSSQLGRAPAAWMRWPFAKWGADVLISGHAHEYERFMHDGMPYFVNGLGGATRYKFKKPQPGSVVRYQKNFGAQRVTIGEGALIFDFYNVRGRLIDRFSVPAERP